MPRKEPVKPPISYNMEEQLLTIHKITIKLRGTCHVPTHLGVRTSYDALRKRGLIEYHSDGKHTKRHESSYVTITEAGIAAAEQLLIDRKA